MHILLITILVIAIFFGVLTKEDSNHQSIGSGFFSLLGFKSREELQKDEMNKLVSKYLKEQSQYLGDTQEVLGPLSKMVEDSYGKGKDGDFLMIKSIMKKFEDQNFLMVQNGKELMALKEKQKKINQKLADDAELALILSQSSQKDMFQKQQDLLKELNEKMQQMKNDSILVKDSQLVDKLKTASNKTISSLENLKEQKNRINNLNSNKDTSIRDKIEEQNRRNKDLIESNRSHIQDQQRDLKDRMRDQLDRAKDRR